MGWTTVAVYLPVPDVCAVICNNNQRTISKTMCGCADVWVREEVRVSRGQKMRANTKVVSERQDQETEGMDDRREENRQRELSSDCALRRRAKEVQKRMQAV